MDEFNFMTNTNYFIDILPKFIVKVVILVLEKR